jgi:hypothetical protein
MAALLGAAVAVLPALAAAPSEVSLEVNKNCVRSEWPCWATAGAGGYPSPATPVTIATGGEVKFTNHSSVKATVVWAGSAPTCDGVPASPETGWEGTCKFEKAGTYKYESSTLYFAYTKYEIVVEGTGTTTSTGTGTTTETNPPNPTGTSTSGSGSQTQAGGGAPNAGAGNPAGSLFAGGQSSACRLSSIQHGQTVHGSVDVSPAAAGGRLEVQLLAADASLASAAHASHVQVGRLVRSALEAGTDRFTVSLDARARHALRVRGHLALTVRVLLASAQGSTATLTRSVTLRS